MLTDAERERIDKIILSDSNRSKKRTLRVWREYRKELKDEDGKRIIAERIAWLRKSMKKHKKGHSKKKKEE